MIVKTSAIVLKAIDFQETSKIVTLLTKSHGKIAVIAKGAKRPKSKYAGLMEMGNILDIVLFVKNTRSVQTISEAAYKKKAFNIRYDFQKMAISTAVIEMVYQLLHEHEINQPMYNFTESFLIWLNEVERDVRNLFPYLQLRLAELMGVGLQLNTDSLSENYEGMSLDMASGSIFKDNVHSSTWKLTSSQARYLILALQFKSSTILDLYISNKEIKNLIYILDVYLKHHIEGLKDRTSDAIFEQILY